MYQNFYYSIFMWSSICFGRHTAHHQQPKTALAVSGFLYVELVDVVRHTVPDNVHQFHVWKTRGCQCSFRLLLMGGVSPEICWASYKYGIIKCWYIVATCWIFLYELFVLHMKKLLRQRQKCLLLAKWKLECHRVVSSCYFSGTISISKRIFEPSETN